MPDQILQYAPAAINPYAEIKTQIASLVDTLTFLKQHNHWEKILINLEKTRFFHPFTIISLACLNYKLSAEKREIDFCFPENSNTAFYLKNVSFPHGLEPEKHENWPVLLENYADKTYLPLIKFSTDRSAISSSVVEKVLSKVNGLIIKNFKIKDCYKDSTSYLISEITDNVIEHSGRKEDG